LIFTSLTQGDLEMKKTSLIFIAFFAAAVFLFYTACVQTQTSQIKKIKGFEYIYGGTFIMGSPENEPERVETEIQHSVTVSPFYMSKYPVTQSEYEKVMGKNPSHFKGSSLPVENVSWYDAVEYCNKRSIKEKLNPAYTIDKSRKDPNNYNVRDDVKWVVTLNPGADGYRLPTESEWEYACRAETTTPFNTGNNITTEQANYNGNYPYNNNAKGKYRAQTTSVGSFPPNKWGLYDMHGNVWEWCWDWYGDYSKAVKIDPEGPLNGDFRVIRGGSWYVLGQNLRSGIRYFYPPFDGYYHVGFRVVRGL
jgi:formylglycine-generating enzyme required for sulfatase activity